VLWRAADLRGLVLSAAKDPFDGDLHGSLHENGKLLHIAPVEELSNSREQYPRSSA
jgi:hypothetical protein